MKDPVKVYFLQKVSSEMIHKKVIKELRELDFKAFKLIVLSRLCKELHLKPTLFEREYITINYKTEDRILVKYRYHLNKKNSPGFDGCYGFWCNPPTKRLAMLEENNIPTMPLNIRPYIHEIRLFLTKMENACTENIFLETGSKEKQEKLRKFMQGSIGINLENGEYSVHDVANILKEYFNEMTEPLFPLKYYRAYKRISRLERSFKELESDRMLSQLSLRGRLMPPDSAFKTKEKQIFDCIQLIVQLMPFWKRELLYNLIDILNVVYTYRDYNHMNATVLGLIFAPLLICPRSVSDNVETGVSKDMCHFIGKMIKLGKDTFGAPYDLQTDVWQYVRNQGTELGLTGAYISAKRL